MALDTFAPEQWAQHFTAQHYQALLNAGWPEAEVQQCANTLFNFTLLSGQLLMQEPNLTLPGDNTVELTEDSAVQVIDYFAETIANALNLALQQGLPGEVRQKVVETLAEDVYGYCKQMTASILTASPAPPREELGQWLSQTAQDALSHYLGEFEKENGPVTRQDYKAQPESVAEPTAPELTPDNLPNTSFQQPLSQPERDKQPLVEPEPSETDYEEAETVQGPAIPSDIKPPDDAKVNIKLGAIALLLKSLPASAHNRVLRLFSPELHPTIVQLSQDDHWIAHVDPVALHQQLDSLKQALKQPSDHPGHLLTQLLREVSWDKVLTALKPERPIWTDYLTSLKQGDSFDTPIPQFMQRELLAHLSRQLQSSLQQEAIPVNANPHDQAA